MQNFAGNWKNLASTLSEIGDISGYQQMGYMISVFKELFLLFCQEQTMGTRVKASMIISLKQILKNEKWNYFIETISVQDLLQITFPLCITMCGIKYQFRKLAPGEFKFKIYFLP